MNVPTSVVLGIDVGTTNVKVALVALGDAPRAVATATRSTPADPDRLVAAVVRGVAEALAAAPETRVVAVGVASMAETGSAVDRHGRPLTAFVDWSDLRATDTARNLSDEVDPDDLFVRTGVRLGPKTPLAKWAWFAEHEPTTWSRTAMWAGAADVVVHALTGRWVTDHTLAGRSGALVLGSDGFDAGLARAGGLDPAQLPEVSRPGEAAGTVCAGPFTDAGLQQGAPVYVAGHDHAVGAHAVGVRAPGQVADSLGTSEAIYAVLDDAAACGAAERRRVAANGMSLVRTVAGERSAVVAGSPAAGRLVAWWCRVLAPGRSPSTLFDGLEAPVRPDLDAPFVLPYLLGRQAPFPDPAARLDVVGLGVDDDEVRLRDALCSGLSLHARWMIEEATGRVRPSEVVLLGGPARNVPWMRRKAALSPWRTSRAEHEDAVVLGAALVAAERAGLPTGTVATQAISVPPTPDASETFDRFVAAALRDDGRPPTATVGRTTRGTA
ncbi:L-fuculokinase [Oerskovia sp. KBS0722]|uniref:FGGY-family carbohydrate kinase n=1 Tax=Oerskovia sp. KBS0722 TaxID=1179673 RepID=UPI00143DD6ED|nr:FGGY family carbohydrate kinase [Oerskovia sp. KBS0722]